MTESDFEDLLDRHGADIALWPADQAHAANLLLARSAEARALREQAQNVETLLADALPELVPIGLKNRILAHVGTDPGDRPAWLDWLTAAFWRPVTLAMVPLVLGFALGVSFPEAVEDYDDDVSLLVFADLELGADLGTDDE